MNTDSLLQIIDRHAIAVLKVARFTEAGNLEAAAMAQQVADDLAVAGDVYLWECLTGKRKVKAISGLRFHDHRQAEGKWPGKKAAGEEPQTIMECAGLLAAGHAEHWSIQTKIQNLKKLIDGAPDLPDVVRLQAEFVVCQRRLDVLNQLRSELIQKGDSMLKEAIDGRGA